MTHRRILEPGSPPALIAAAIERHAMAAPGVRIGVAVSGGADSVCLLNSLALLAGSHGWRLTVLHLHHGLRGADADADAAFVELMARNLRLPCVVEVNPIAAGPDWENRARCERLDFFQRQMREMPLDRIATGHTLDDQAETVLLRILRGASPESLSGILPVTQAGLIRPMLEVTHQSACKWLREQGIEWREDLTNASKDYTRNWLRHDILPAVEARYPSARATLARHAAAAQHDSEFWAVAVRNAADVFVAGPDSSIAGVQPLAAIPSALRRRVLRWALSRYSNTMIDFVHVEAVDHLVTTGRGSGRVRIGRVEARLSMGMLRIGPPPAPPAIKIQTVSGPGEYEMPWRGTRLKISRFDGKQAALRAWKPGDHASWTTTPKRLKELFQMARIPAWQRAGWPVLESEGLIVWAGDLGGCAGIEADEEA